MRLVVLALLLMVRAAFAQVSINDLKDETKRIDMRWLDGYTRTMKSREFLASMHDSIKHPAYTAVRAEHASYMTIRNALEKSLAAGEKSTATKQVGELDAAGEVLDEKLSAYINSSRDSVEKIQIAAGVLAFVVCGLFYWLFKRHKK